MWTAIYSVIRWIAPLQVCLIRMAWEPKEPLQVVSEALIYKHVNEGINTRVEGDNYNADDIDNVAILLWIVKVVQHVDNKDRKPRDAVYQAHLKSKQK